MLGKTSIYNILICAVLHVVHNNIVSSSSDDQFNSHTVEDFVEDVPLDILREKLLLKEEVVSILYYKDWLHDYNYVLDTYNFVFTRLGKQISFLKIDCENKSNCPEEKLPKVVVLSRLSKKPIFYNGPLKLFYLIQFYKKILQPVKYIASRRQFFDYLNECQFTVIASLNPSQRSDWRRYLQFALEDLQRYPTTNVNFGVITNKNLGKSLNLKQSEVSIFDQTSDLKHVMDISLIFDQTAYFIYQNIDSWALRKYFDTRTKSSFLTSQLFEKEANASVIGFVKNQDQMKNLEQVAISYFYKQNQVHACKEYCNCYTTIPQTQQHCKAEVHHYSYFPKTIFKNDLSCVEVVRSIMYINDKTSYLVKSFFGTSEYRLTLNCNLMTQVHGLKHRSNSTVNFVLFDYYLHESIAHTLGVSDKLKSGLVIVDVKNEDEYLMQENVTSKNIANHVYKFTMNNLVSTRNENVQTSMLKDQNFILSNKQLQNKIHNSTKDILLFYTSESCAFCMIFRHYFEQVQSLTSSIETIEFYKIDESVNVEAHLAVEKFPTIIFFPAEKPSDSVKFNEEISEKSLIHFIIENSSEETKNSLIKVLCSLVSDEEIRVKCNKYV